MTYFYYDYIHIKSITSRLSDEDFSDSDISDCEQEETSEVRSKMLVRNMWKALMKERGILVTREGVSSEMTREYAEYIKNILIKKAADLSSPKCSQDWRPK